MNKFIKILRNNKNRARFKTKILSSFLILIVKVSFLKKINGSKTHIL